MFYQINFESRSPYRYVAYMRGRKPSDAIDSYFSVEVQVAQIEWGTLLDDNVRYSVEICEIAQPHTRTFYTLKSRRYCVSGDGFVSTIGYYLVKYNVVPEGTPFQVNIELDGKNHSFMQMNARCLHASNDTHFETVLNLFSEFSEIQVSNDDEIECNWHTFEKGSCRFEVWKWFEESFGYPVNTLLAYAPKSHW